MRISDWSSDVCSSDLAERLEGELEELDAAIELRLVDMLEMTPEIVNRLADGLIEKGAALGGQADELFASRCRVLDLLYQLERRPGQFAQGGRKARMADFEPGRAPRFDPLAAHQPTPVARH